MSTEHDPERILTGLLWLALTPDEHGRSRYSDACDTGKLARSLGSAGVPAAVVAEAIREDLGESTALEAARRWARWERPRETWEAKGEAHRVPRPHGCLVLAGPVGTGKSVAAARLLLERAKAGLWRARWVDCRGLVATGWDKINGIADLIETPALVLDDLSAAVASRDAARAALAAQLGQRHEARRLTVITTNLGPSSFADIVGPAVWDRIGQDGEVVTCASASLRALQGPSSIPSALRDADRLAALVRRLGVQYGPVPDDVLELDRVEAIRQLMRLLGCRASEAMAAAESADECKRRKYEALAECHRRLAASLEQERSAANS